MPASHLSSQSNPKLLTLMRSKLRLGHYSSVFFPTPGPVAIDPSHREQTQRELLTKYAPDINLDDFLTRNPILIRDRHGTSSGCFSSIAVMIALAAVALASTWFLAALAA